MRSALLMSLVLHLLGLVLIAVAVRPRFIVPPRLQGIPVNFIALAAPAPAVTERTRPTPTSSPAVTARTRPTPKPSAARTERTRPRPTPSPARTEGTRTVAAKPVDSVPDPLQPRPRREPPPLPEQQRLDPPRREPPPEPQRLDPPRREPPPREEPKRGPKPEPDLPRRGSADTTQVMRSELPRVGDSRGAMQMRVEGDVLPYAYYLSIVQGKIAGFWEPPAGIEQQPGEVAAIVWFRIEKDGAVRSNSVEEPSGIIPFDTCALRALARALPLPPLPETYPGDHLIIHLRFVYSHETSVPAEAR